MSERRVRVAVMISGRGSNLQALIDAARAPAAPLPVDIALVVSNVADVQGLSRAQSAGIPTAVIDHRDFNERREFDNTLAERIDLAGVDLIVLAGFMRILGHEFIHRFSGRMLNIHPSLLPKFKGLDTHQRALDAGESEHGASVHFVTAELDGGPVVLQAKVPVQPADDANELAQRVLHQEHRILVDAVRWYCEGRISLRGNTAVFDGRELGPDGA